MAQGHDSLDFTTIPESKGIPRAVIVLALIGVVGVFIIGGAVAFSAAHGHVWPALQSMRIDLTKGH